MAKKKKKATRRRHHRVGAVRGMGGVVMKVAAIGAGAVAATFLNSTVKKSFASLPAWAPAAIVVGAGVFLPKVLKNQTGQNVATGMLAAGTLFLLNETFLSLPGIAGMGAVPKGLVYRATPKLQQTVGAPGFMDKAVGGSRDMMVVGALYDN